MRIAGGTAKRITKRIINFILVIWGVVTLSFCLQVFTGTDPAEMIVRKVNVFATEEQIQAVREELGLDAPFLERYTDYIKGVLTGDLGTAITNRQPVIENIKDGEVLRNALPAAITLFAQYCAALFGTSALVESVFSIQGLGIYLTKSCESMDIYGISGSILVCGVLFVLFNTLADLLSSAICPAYRRKAA